MPSLLDLPDDVLYEIGLHFEHDAQDLGLFLLIHPRINNECAKLRYRNRHWRFDLQSPLAGYLKHPLWLKNIRGIMLILQCERGLETVQCWNKRYSVRTESPEQYDQQMAQAIYAMEDIHEATFEGSRAYMSSRENMVNMQQSLTALRQQKNLQHIRLVACDSYKQLQMVMELARSVPNCSLLHLQGNGWPIDLSPLADFLASSTHTRRLESFTFVDFDKAKCKALAVDPVLTNMPDLPLLKHLRLGYFRYDNHDERMAHYAFLEAILKRATEVEYLEIMGPDLLEMAQRGVQLAPHSLHLTCNEEIQLPLSTWNASWPSVRSLTLSGRRGADVVKNILEDDARGIAHPLSGLKALQVTHDTPMKGEQREELEALATASRLTFQSVDAFWQPYVVKRKPANPVKDRS